MGDMEQMLKERVENLFPHLTERQRRLSAACEARALGRGGISRVSRVTGLSRTTIYQGLSELEKGETLPDRVRRPGGGRKKFMELHPGVLAVLEQMVDPVSRGDPMSPLRWTCKSTRQLATALTHRGYPVSRTLVSEMLHHLGFTLQANSKTLEEGSDHPDRNEQFAYINKRVKSYLRRGLPVISVDTKKKELVGPYRSVGREYQRKGRPEKVRVHDFIDEDVSFRWGCVK